MGLMNCLVLLWGPNSLLPCHPFPTSRREVFGLKHLVKFVQKKRFRCLGMQACNAGSSQATRGYTNPRSSRKDLKSIQLIHADSLSRLVLEIVLADLYCGWLHSAVRFATVDGFYIFGGATCWRPHVGCWRGPP